ncbi:MAG TPA: sigma-54 dependent transcriptional regulator [Anaeromyxobacteraceae bacterium]|nr:sigma-54 dependent transcriptional regulator [Anaeromyxobacteraceae bacterium]
MSDAVRILVVDDEEIVRESLTGWLRQDGYLVGSAADGRAALESLRAESWAIVLLDLKMPGPDGLQVLEEGRRLRPEASFVLMTAYATVDTAVAAMKLGAYDYLVKPFDPEELSALVRRIAAQQALLEENESLRRALKREYGFHELVSKNATMQRVFDLARVAARSASTILILGESGSGKEVLARAIHAESPRAGEAFVAISCAALTETLLESELFGHEKGAFTGAVARRKGKFELAQGGTLFLDEIGDISPKLQLDLLRVLEERRFQRVGGSETIEADARVVAATHRDLKKAVAEGRFREDLFYRLNVIPVTLPPLRERREDIPLLVQHFLGRLTKDLKRPLDGVSPQAMAALVAHPWPGNVRELRNVLERGAVVATSSLIELADLGLPAPEPARGASPSGASPSQEEPLSLEEVEKRHVADVLSWAQGNVTHAARILGIDRMTLYNKMKRYGLRRAEEELPGPSTSRN